MPDLRTLQAVLVALLATPPDPLPCCIGVEDVSCFPLALPPGTQGYTGGSVIGLPPPAPCAPGEEGGSRRQDAEWRTLALAKLARSRIAAHLG